MARLLVRAAPGVRSTSSRLTRVVGVAESVGAASGAPDTFTVSFVVVTLSGKCSTGWDPEFTTTLCSAWLKPGATTVTVYSPTATALKEKWPPESVFAVVAQSEVLDRSITMAFSTGRCCGSWTTPRTEPKTVAKAAAPSARNAASSMKRMTRMKSPRPQGSKQVRDQPERSGGNGRSARPERRRAALFQAMEERGGAREGRNRASSVVGASGYSHARWLH